MNPFFTFIMGLVFFVCFYGQFQSYAVSWIYVFGMVFSSVVIALTFGDDI